MSNWYYAKNGNKHGPLSGAELKALAAKGAITQEDKVWREGLKEWKSAGKVIGLFPTGKIENTSSTPPPLPEESLAGTSKSESSKVKREKATPAASLDDEIPFNELFNNTQKDTFSHVPGPRQTTTEPGIDRLKAIFSRFDANQFTWGYRITLAIGILGIFLPWYSASSVFNSRIAAGSSSTSVSGILLIWGILALIAAGWGLLVSFIKPKWITQFSCATSMAVFSIIAVLQFNALSPAGVNVHSSYGGFSAFGSLTSGVAVGAWLTLICGIAGAVLSFFERFSIRRNGQIPVPNLKPNTLDNPGQKQASLTSSASDLDVGNSYRLYKSDKTPFSRKLVIALAILCCLIVASAFLVNKFNPGILGKGINALTGVVVADAYIEPMIIDQIGPIRIAQALIKAAEENPKSTTIVVKLWLKSQNRTDPNLIYTHTFNVIAIESARKSRNPVGFLMDANEHGVTYQTTLNNAIAKIERGW